MRLHLLFAVPALLLVACPPTSMCPPGLMWNGSACVTAVDTGPFDGGRDANGEDAPCGGGCSGTDVCNTSTSECVQCLGTDASTCSTPGDNACVDERCVECATDANCEELDAAQCNTTTHTCEACTDSDACTGRTGTEVCNSGTCVECSADDESACTAGVCDLVAGACTTIPAAMTGLCQACVSDRQCRTGQLCVMTRWDDPATAAADPVDAGRYCMWRQDATGAGAPNGSCFTSGRPYVRSVMSTSLTGEVAEVCTLAVSTCDAHIAYRTVDCMTLNAAGDARCGDEELNDGFCRAVDASNNRCTVQCTSDDDCRSGVTCDTGASPPVCAL